MVAWWVAAMVVQMVAVMVAMKELMMVELWAAETAVK